MLKITILNVENKIQICKDCKKNCKGLSICENYIDTINLILYIIALFTFKAGKINRNFNITCKYFYLY